VCGTAQSGVSRPLCSVASTRPTEKGGIGGLSAEVVGDSQSHVERASALARH
jgi:hypothetical protein